MGGSRQRFLVITWGRTNLPREAIGPNGSNCLSRGSVPLFLREPIATCDFPRGGGVWTAKPPSGSAHVLKGVQQLRMYKYEPGTYFTCYGRLELCSKDISFELPDVIIIMLINVIFHDQLS